MGTYFTNKTLDGLWSRLVNATEKLCGDGGWTGTGPIYEEDGYMTIDIPSADEHVFPQDSISWGSNIGTLPIAITELDKDVVYAVTNTRLSIIGYIEYKGGISNTGMKGIHDALLSHFNLTHETPPTTPGDYMKGIAVAARFHKNGIIDTESRNSLAEIVDLLKETGPVVPIISQNGDYIVIENIKEITAQGLDIRELYLIVPNPITTEVMSKFSINLNDNYILASDIITYEDDTGKEYLKYGDTVQMEYCYYDENNNDFYVRSNTITYENKAPTSPALFCTLNENGTWSYKVYNGSSYSDGNWYLYTDDNALITSGFIMPGETDTDLSKYMSEGARYYLKITMYIDSAEFTAYSDTVTYIKEDIGGGDKYITTHLTIENTGSNYNFIISHAEYDPNDFIWSYTINIYDQNKGGSPLVATKTIDVSTNPSVGLTVLATDIYSGWSYLGYYKVEVISDVMDYSDTKAEQFLIWEYN